MGKARGSVFPALASMLASLLRYERRQEESRQGPSKKALRRLAGGIGVRMTSFVTGTVECGAVGCTKTVSVAHDGTGIRFCCRAHRHLRHNRNGLRAQKFAARAAARAAQ